MDHPFARRILLLVRVAIAGMGVIVCVADVQGQYDPNGQPFVQQPRYNPNNMVLPGPPADVGTPTRPTGWPGAPPAEAQPQRRPGSAPVQSAPPAAPPAGQGAPFENQQAMQFDLVDLDGARPIARVGNEVIQDYEVSTYVNEFLELNADRIPPNQLAKLREKLTRDRLNHLVEIKLALVDAQRKVPPDAYPKIVDSIGDEFETKEVRKKLKDLNLATRGELEAKLRERGTSLEREKQVFVEQQLAFGWIGQQTRTKHEATHEDMLAYYLENIKDYSFPAKARFEELRVKVANFPSRIAAKQALGDMGNAVLNGAPFADVARARSQGANASSGGQYDWTTQGSLASPAVDQAVFSLPVGTMSTIIDDERSPTMSIIRVIERTDAGQRPFGDVQSEIKEKLAAAHQEKDKQRLHDYLVKLREETPIWTIFDGPDQANGKMANLPAGPPGDANTSLRPTATGKTPPKNPYLR